MRRKGFQTKAVWGCTKFRKSSFAPRSWRHCGLTHRAIRNQFCAHSVQIRKERKEGIKSRRPGEFEESGFFWEEWAGAAQPKKSTNCFARKLGDGTGTGRMRSVLHVVEVLQRRWDCH